MRVFNGFDNLPLFNRPVVTVGSYDGVHAGHRVLLGKVIDTAKKIQGESIIITFSPHPRQVLSKEKFYQLNSLEEKIILLEELGIDNLIVVPFNEEFSRISSHDFVSDYLVDLIDVKVLIVGYNHHFGHNKEGDFNYLYKLRTRFGFDIIEQSREDVDNEKVSSTVVRHLIENGEMTKAAHCLTKPYFMLADIASDGVVNDSFEYKLLPPAGTYHVSIQTSGEKEAASLIIANDGILKIKAEGSAFAHQAVISFE